MAKVAQDARINGNGRDPTLVSAISSQFSPIILENYLASKRRHLLAQHHRLAPHKTDSARPQFRRPSHDAQCLELTSAAHGSNGCPPRLRSRFEWLPKSDRAHWRSGVRTPPSLLTLPALIARGRRRSCRFVPWRSREAYRRHLPVHQRTCAPAFSRSPKAAGNIL